MIRSAASLARRVVGSPDRLARGLAVLAVLVAAATAMLAGPAPARALAAGPACAAAGPHVAVMTGAKAPAPEARRTIFERTDIGAVDIEAPTDLGLPRAPSEAARPGHVSAASYGYSSDTARAPAPAGSPHRPPRAA